MVIVLEGVDCVGKSTQAGLLATHFRNAVVARHPGFTPTGQRLREIVLDEGLEDCDLAARLLFWADHLITASLLKKSGSDGIIVFDRHPFYSNLAYGTALGTERRILNELAEVLRGTWVVPDLTIVLDVPISVVAERLRTKTGRPDAIESRGLEYLQRVRQNYLQMVHYRSEVVVVAADRPKEAVHQSVLKLIESTERSERASIYGRILCRYCDEFMARREIGDEAWYVCMACGEVVCIPLSER